MKSWIRLAPVFLAACAADTTTSDGPTLGFERVLTLGSEQPPGDIPSRPTALTSTADGSFILFIAGNTSDPMPMRFAADGTFVEQIGGSGQGPGEFRRPQMGTVTPGDSVLVHDRPTFTVLKDGSARTIRWAPHEVGDIDILSWPDSVLFSVWAPMGPRPYMIVSMRDDEVETLAEFGMERSVQSWNHSRAYSSIPREDRVWVANAYEYVVHQLSFEGDTTRSLDLSSPEFNTETTGVSPDSIPRSYVLGLESIGDTLITAFSAAKDGWEKAWDNDDYGPVPGSPGAIRAPPEQMLYETVIELRSIEAGELIGSQRLPGIFVDILPNGSIAQFVVEGPGFYFVEIWSR